MSCPSSHLDGYVEADPDADHYRLFVPDGTRFFSVRITSSDSQTVFDITFPNGQGQTDKTFIQLGTDASPLPPDFTNVDYPIKVHRLAATGADYRLQWTCAS